MNQAAFYAVVTTVSFTLLGLWWLAVKDRVNVVQDSARFRRMAYLVSLQFVIPATVGLFAQVAPDEKLVWRTAFGAGGIVGAAAVGMLAAEVRATTRAQISPVLFAIVGVPLYLLVAVVAFVPTLAADAGLNLAPIEVEGLLFSAIVFLGVQEAWVVAMAPLKEHS